MCAFLFQINLNNCADEVEVIKKSRGYSYEDEVRERLYIVEVFFVTQ